MAVSRLVPDVRAAQFDPEGAFAGYSWRAVNLYCFGHAQAAVRAILREITCLMIGQIYLKRRQERSYNGIPIGVLKSGLQKYARRARLGEGLWCLIELDLFQLVETELDGVAEYLRRKGRAVFPLEEAEYKRAIIQKAKALRTNLVNRLIVMVSEEVSISAYWMPLVVNELYELWKADRNRTISRKHLIDIYKHLVRQEKIRLISDLKSVYLLPPDYVKPDRRQDLRIIHSNLLASLGLSRMLEGCQAVSENLIDSCTVDLRPFLDEKDEELRRVVNGILYHLKHKNDHVFHWLGQLIDRQRGPQGEPKLGGKKDLLNVVWHLLLGFADKREGLWNEPQKTYPENFDRVREIIGVLKKWYETMTHREKPIYLYHAILLIIRRDEIDWRAEIPEINTPWHEVEALYRTNVSGKVIELDDFVFDIHTGRLGENSLTRFAREGALVENENQRFRNENYRLIYCALKERLDVYRRKGLAGINECFGGEQ